MQILAFIVQNGLQSRVQFRFNSKIKIVKFKYFNCVKSSYVFVLSPLFAFCVLRNGANTMLGICSA